MNIQEVRTISGCGGDAEVKFKYAIEIADLFISALEDEDGIDG